MLVVVGMAANMVPGSAYRCRGAVSHVPSESPDRIKVEHSHKPVLGLPLAT
jgi:hypothetical protein